MRRFPLGLLTIAFAATLVAQPRLRLDYPAMARKLVGQLALKRGERVMSVAHPGVFDDLLPYIRYEVMRAGGIDLGVVEVLREPVPESFDAALLQTDYKALADAERRFAAALREGEVHILSPGGTDLRFRTGDRPVNLQDGDASAARAALGKVLVDKEVELPAGVVRVAPLEDTVGGVIAFPPSQWDGRPVEGLRLRFSKGRVVEITASSGRDAVEAEIEKAGEAGRAFREIGLGFNPLLAVAERSPWIPYYGYGAGVVRLSLGDNTELGGTVTGGYVRWNFFTDLTVTVGGTTWVRGGKLVM